MRYPSRLLILGTGDLVLGLIFLLSSATRTSSRAFTGVKDIAPIPTWGLTLAALGVLLLLAAALHRTVTPAISRTVVAAVATLGASWTSFWAIELLLTAASDPRVSWSGGALWLLFGTVPHLFLAYGREG